MSELINEARLQALIDEVAREELAAFDMYHWAQRGKRVRDNHSCGTAACLAGHAALLAGHTLVWSDAVAHEDLEVTARCQANDTSIAKLVETVALEWLEAKGDVYGDLNWLFGKAGFSKATVFNELRAIAARHNLDVDVPVLAPSE